MKNLEALLALLSHAEFRLPLPAPVPFRSDPPSPPLQRHPRATIFLVSKSRSVFTHAGPTHPLDLATPMKSSPRPGLTTLAAVRQSM